MTNHFRRALRNEIRRQVWKHQNGYATGSWYAIECWGNDISGCHHSSRCYFPRNFVPDLYISLDKILLHYGQQHKVERQARYYTSESCSSPQKTDCHNLLGLKTTLFLEELKILGEETWRTAALITFRQHGDNKFLSYGFLEVWHHLYKTWLVIHSS